MRARAGKGPGPGYQSLGVGIIVRGPWLLERIKAFSAAILFKRVTSKMGGLFEGNDVTPRGDPLWVIARNPGRPTFNWDTQVGNFVFRSLKKACSSLFRTSFDH